MPPGTCRKREFPKQQLTVSRWLTHCTQHPQAVLGWAAHTCIERIAPRYCFLSTIMLVRMSNTRCHAASQAVANTGLNGAPSFIAAALPRHRDNSKQFSDAGVEAHNGDKKHSSLSRWKRNKPNEAGKTEQNKKQTLQMSKQRTFSGETCTEERARLAQA